MCREEEARLERGTEDVCVEQTSREKMRGVRLRVRSEGRERSRDERSGTCTVHMRAQYSIYLSLVVCIAIYMYICTCIAK